LILELKMKGLENRYSMCAVFVEVGRLNGGGDEE
jgi:hypothetical protein